MTLRALAIGPIGIAEAMALLSARTHDTPTRRPAFRLPQGSAFGDLLDFDLTTEQDYIDETVFGDAAPTIIPGLRTTRVRLRVAVTDSSILMGLHDGPVLFDEAIAGQRLRGEIMVTRWTLNAARGGILTADIEGVATGPFMVEEESSAAPGQQADTDPVRRGIALAGLGEDHG